MDESDNESFSQIYRKNNNEFYIVGLTDGVNKLYAYDGNGNAIGSFGSSGKFTFSQLTGYGVSILDIIFVGNYIYIAGAAINTQTNKTDLLVCKMNSQGVLDNSFGINGYYRADLASGKNDHATAMKVLSNGSVFLTGLAENSNGMHKPASFLLASDGTLISNYGSNGVITYELPSSLVGISRAMTENAQGQFNLLCYNQKANSEEGVLVQLKTNVSGIGIEEFTQVSSFKAFPNPVNDVLTLEFNSRKEMDYNLSLLNTTGQLIAQKTVSASNGVNTFDLSDMIEKSQFRSISSSSDFFKSKCNNH